MSKCKCVWGVTMVDGMSKWVADSSCSNCGGTGEVKWPALNLPDLPTIDFAKEPSPEIKRECAEQLAVYWGTKPFRALAEAVAMPAAIEGMKADWHARNQHARMTWDMRKGSTLQVEFFLGGERAWVVFAPDCIDERNIREALEDAWRSIGGSLARRWKP